MVRKQTGAALVIDFNVKIDFNGLTYTVKTANENGSAVIIAEGAFVTLENGTIQVLRTEKDLFSSLIANNGNLTTNDITLRGNNLTAEAVTVQNNGTLDLQAGTVVNSLAATANVTKDASVELEAPEGFDWLDGTTLIVHVHDYTFKTEVVEVNFDRSGYTRHTCCCGDSYIDSVVSRLIAYAQNLTTGEKYETLAEAVAEAKVGETVQMLKKSQTGAALEINADITIDLNGFTYTVKENVDGAAIVVVAESVKAEITNGMVQIAYSSRLNFNCLVNNLGALEATNITLKAVNADAENAVAVKGNAITGDATVINP